MLPVAPKAPRFVPVTAVDLRDGIRPLWARRGAELLESFGAMKPFADIAMVAAFPVDALQAGRAFAIYKDAGGAQSIRVGVIRATDAAAWR